MTAPADGRKGGIDKSHNKFNNERVYTKQVWKFKAFRPRTQSWPRPDEAFAQAVWLKATAVPAPTPPAPRASEVSAK